MSQLGAFVLVLVHNLCVCVCVCVCVFVRVRVSQVAIGLMIAVNILVGNALGAGDWKKAKSCFRVALVMNGTN